MPLSCTFQRTVLAALCDTDGGSCHFHGTVLAALCDAGICLCLFLLLKLELITDLCQTRVGRRFDKANFSWSGGRHSKLLSLENHVDLDSFDRHHFPLVNNSLCLPPYHVTFV